MIIRKFLSPTKAGIGAYILHQESECSVTGLALIPTILSPWEEAIEMPTIYALYQKVKGYKAERPGARSTVVSLPVNWVCGSQVASWQGSPNDSMTQTVSSLVPIGFDIFQQKLLWWQLVQ